MNAIEKLIELRKQDSSIVAIAKEKNGDVFFFYNSIPEPIYTGSFYSGRGCPFVSESIKFDSDNWEECIVTYKDLEPYEVKSITISESEYQRLIEAEKTLKEIQKFFM